MPMVAIGVAGATETQGGQADQPEADTRFPLNLRGDEALDEVSGGLRALVEVASGE